MRKDYNRLITLLLTIFVSVAAFAESRSVEEAQREALSFVMSGATGMKYAYAPKSVELRHTVQKINSSDAAAYLFQVGEDRGFVLVSADDNTTAILGYGNDGNFDATNIPENMQTWFQHYAEEISWAAEHGASIRTTAKNSGAQISPLLGGIVWNQNTPFWNQCPYDSDGKRSYSGCVATAAAQVMRFWKHPATGEGSHSYTWKKSNGRTQTLSANFGNTTYDWDNMLESYNGSYTTTQANAVATLLYHLGVATDMGYSSNGSGTQTELAAQALFKYFGYDKSLYAVRPDYVGFGTFEEKMFGELQAGRPVLMSGATTQAEGHAFVCDGYDGEFFHINWGWGGSQNGYFALSALDPAEQGMGGAASGEGFHVGILGVMGIMPDQGGEQCPAILGTLGMTLQAPRQVASDEQFTISLNQIANSGIAHFEGGIVGLAILDEEGSFVDWFCAYNIETLPVGYYYAGNIDFPGKLSNVYEDGKYKIVPMFTDAEYSSFEFMNVGYDTPEYFSFTKSGNVITFDVEYSLKNLEASAEGNNVYFNFESNAPYYHIKLYNSEETVIDEYIDFANVMVSEVPAGTWTVWVCAADIEKNDVGEPLTTTVTTEDIDYNVYNLQARVDGKDLYFSFESDAPKFHIKVYSDTQSLANTIIDFKEAVLRSVPDDTWTIWVCPCNEKESHYLADAVSITVTIPDTTTGIGNTVKEHDALSGYDLSGRKTEHAAPNTIIIKRLENGRTVKVLAK